MDNIKEISLEELNRISGGELSRTDIGMIESYIKFMKTRGHTLEEALAGMSSPEVLEYIKEHW